MLKPADRDRSLAREIPANCLVGAHTVRVELASETHLHHLTLRSQVVPGLMIFLLAMVLNPDVQRRAQQELDSVLGGTRLPAFDDRTALPYTNGLVQEIFRWHSPTSLGSYCIFTVLRPLIVYDISFTPSFDSG